jgi:hypothetical protein
MVGASNRFELYSKHDVFLHVVWAAVPKNYNLNMDSVCVCGGKNVGLYTHVTVNYGVEPTIAFGSNKKLY